MEEITFSDQDLLRQWEEGLGQLQLKKEEVVWYKIFPVAVSGTQNHITLRTETGEYTLVTTYSVPDPKVYLSVFRYGVNDPDCLPIESTFAQAAQRQGESSYFSSGTWLGLRAVSGYRAMFSAPWTAVTVSTAPGKPSLPLRMPFRLGGTTWTSFWCGSCGGTTPRPSHRFRTEPCMNSRCRPKREAIPCPCGRSGRGSIGWKLPRRRTPSAAMGVPLGRDGGLNREAVRTKSPTHPKR